MKKLILDVGTVFRNFRECFGASLEQARQNYHLPKSQFLDSTSAEKESSASSTLKVGEVLRSFFNCLSNAIQDAREGSNLPKSRFRQMVQEKDMGPSFQVSSDFDDALFVDPAVKRMKLDSSVLPGTDDGNIELSDAAFEGTGPEETGGSWKGLYKSE